MTLRSAELSDGIINCVSVRKTQAQKMSPQLPLLIQYENASYIIFSGGKNANSLRRKT